MRLTTAALLTAMSGVLVISQGPVLAQATDSITVHCVLVSPIDPRFSSCQDQHGTIQSAVNHADPGETVLVGAGVFPEQVIITEPLTLEGAGATTVIQPAVVTSYTSSLFSGAPIAAILLVDSTTGVSVTDLTVDGSVAWLTFTGCSPGYVGIFYRAGSGVIENTYITGVHFNPLLLGCQTGLGIFVQSGNGGPGLNSQVAIINNTVDMYQKNGITANEPGTFVAVTGNIVTGMGVTTVIAQNGVQIGFGARGLVSGNAISANYYTPPDYVACGLLFFEAGGGLGRTKSNNYLANEQDTCTAGVGPSSNSPFN